MQSRVKTTEGTIEQPDEPWLEGSAAASLTAGSSWACVGLNTTSITGSFVTTSHIKLKGTGLATKFVGLNAKWKCRFPYSKSREKVLLKVLKYKQFSFFCGSEDRVFAGWLTIYSHRCLRASPSWRQQNQTSYLPSPWACCPTHGRQMVTSSKGLSTCIGVGKKLSPAHECSWGCLPSVGTTIALPETPWACALDPSPPRAWRWKASVVVVWGERECAFSWAPGHGAVSGWELRDREAGRWWEAERHFSWVSQTLVQAPLFIWPHKMQT